MNDLLTAVLAQRDLDQYAAAGRAGRATGRAGVRAHLREVVERNLRMREIVRLYAVLTVEATDPGHPAHPYFVERTRAALATFEAFLAWKPDPPTAARQLLSFWQGLEVLWVGDPDTDFIRVWEAFCDDFFR